MINIKTAATAVASVAVAATTVTHFIRNRKQTAAPVVESTILDPRSVAQIYNIAQDEVSRRMMDGYYDDKPNSEYTRDFTIIYNTLLAIAKA